MGTTGRDRSRWALELRWGGPGRPLPRRWVLADGNAALRLTSRSPSPGPDRAPFDFTTHIRRLCEDVALRCPDLAHVHAPSVLFTVTPARSRSAYGLQARVTPMRFRDGAATRRYRGTVYQVQRYVVDGREVLYLVTFCLPRFLDQTFEEKLITVFHELYHIGPNFDGDLRRHGGRYDVHTHSKKEYDGHMAVLVKRYLASHPDPSVFAFLRHGSSYLRRAYGGLTGVVVPRPKMVPMLRPLGD